jgi:Lysozyme like domain
MGDIWPYGPPRYTNWTQAYDALRALGMSKGDSNTLAAIAGAESSYDLSVINDTPSTGDYSVGAWQINYYANLYAGRTAEFGTPKHLAQSSVSTQASAAHQVWAQQGFSAWSTYVSGAYKEYLSNNVPAGPPPSHQAGPPDTSISPPTEDYSDRIRLAAGHINIAAAQFRNGAALVKAIRK